MQLVIETIVSFLIPFFWNFNWRSITISDYHYPINYNFDIFQRYFFYWTDKRFPGTEFSRGVMQLPYQIYYFITFSIFHNGYVVQHIFFSLVILLSLVLCGKFFKEVLKINNIFLIIILSLLYIFNPFSIVVFWANITLNIVSYLVFPGFLLYMYKAYENQKNWLPNVLKIGILDLLINDGNPAFFLAFNLVCIPVIFGLNFRKNNFSSLVKKTAAIISIQTLYCLFWLPGFVSTITSAVSYVVVNNIGFENNPIGLVSMITSKSTFTELSKLLGFWTLYSGYNGVPYYSYSWFYLRFQALLTLPILIIIIGFIFAKKKQKNYLMLLVLIIISVALISGTNYYLPRILYRIIMESSLGVIFRNPLDKFGAIFSISFVGLLGVSILNISEFLPKTLRNLFIFFTLSFVSIIYLYPLYTGTIFRRSNEKLASYYSEFPNDYRDAADYLVYDSKKPVNLFPFPYLEQYYGTVYKWKDTGYQGAHPAYYLYNINALGGGSPSNEELFDRIATGGAVMEDLNHLSVKYIMYHKDYDWAYPNQNFPNLGISTEEINKNFFEFSVNLKKVFESENIILFENPTNDIGYIKTGNVNSSISYSKINPTRYQFTLNSKTDTENIIFFQSGDKNWYLKSDDCRIIKKTEFENSNQWLVNVPKKKDDYTCTGTIIFMPQRYLWPSLLITFIALVSSITYLIKNKNK